MVAAENFWGSIATQVGGSEVQVTSIITKPDADPHSYEPTAADARTIAGAELVIENGIGYDPWMAKQVSADHGRSTVLDVGHVVGVKEGANPHRWYNPADVTEVIGALVADLSRLRPARSAIIRTQASNYETTSLSEYHGFVSSIRATYGGTKVGASESIFSMLAPALGLDVITPPSFLRAVSEGTDISSADKATIDHQIRTHQIALYVYNRQNATPDIQVQLAECRRAGIPTASVTETLAPATVSYQDWQVAQLRGIQAALARAKGGGST